MDGITMNEKLVEM